MHIEQDIIVLTLSSVMSYLNEFFDNLVQIHAVWNEGNKFKRKVRANLKWVLLLLKFLSTYIGILKYYFINVKKKRTSIFA